MNRQELIEQTGLAFDFIQKLYFEVSYFIKELEGLLAEEEEKFIIGRPSGYGITARSSTGLEANHIRLWPLRKLAVFFVPETSTQRKGGQTVTKLQGNKVIYVRIVLDDRDLAEPTVFFGVLHSFVKKTAPGVSPTKFEHLMAWLEYNDTRVFKDPEEIDHDDARVSFKGKLLTASLYGISNSEQIASQIIGPALSLFREVE
jgi:hypothetical protein